MTILCKHKTQLLPYREWHEDADRREKNGEKQIKCLACGLWIWESLYWRTPCSILVEWVPCSERLPQHNRRVLVWHNDEGLEFLAMRVFNTRTGEWIGLEKEDWPTHWLDGLEAP